MVIYDITTLEDMVENPGGDLIEFRVNGNKVEYRFEGEEEWKELINLAGDVINTRYQVLVNADGDDYRNAFKIPHLGVLTAVHNLLNVTRNYVLIYDVDGKDSIWLPIGLEGNVNGFDESGASEFTGVFVTNKYFKYSGNIEDSYCVIENLTESGLFTNVNNAYFGNIKLGSFKDLQDSGALGKVIAESETEVPNACVNNVMFE